MVFNAAGVEVCAEAARDVRFLTAVESAALKRDNNTVFIGNKVPESRNIDYRAAAMIFLGDCAVLVFPCPADKFFS